MLRLSLACGGDVYHWAVPSEPVTLGADPSCELCAPLRGVSRRHAELRATRRGVLVRDLGSTNGLVSGGERVAEVELTRGESVRLGAAMLRLEDVDSEEQSTALALALREESVAHGRRTGSEWPSAAFMAATADGALRLIRDLERDGRTLSFAEGDRRLLRRARGALGADALLHAVVSPSGDVALAGVDGNLVGFGTAEPEHPQIEHVLAELAVVPEGQVLSRQMAGGQFLISRHGDDLVGAGFRVDGVRGGDLRPLAAWQEDFFCFLAERLTGGGVDLTGGDRAGGTGSIEVGMSRRDLPQGMILGESPKMRALVGHIDAIARSDISALIVGETGAGKEYVARLVHLWSPVSEGPFVAVNCAAIPAELLEAELFGVTRGAATGVEARPGVLARADGGSILLDEIGDMPERLQAKILRVLETGEVQPVGGSQVRRIKARIIAATNRDLIDLVPSGRFRADLYYRLRGVELHVPPLRDRREDVPALALAFAQRAADQYRRRVRGISRAALSLLESHSWPGNVRELENEIKRAVLLCPNGSLLESTHFLGLQHARQAHNSGIFALPNGNGGSSGPTAATRTRRNDEAAAAAPPRTLRDYVEETERVVIREALARHGGNRAATARELGITRNGLAMKMTRLGL